MGKWFILTAEEKACLEERFECFLEIREILRKRGANLSLHRRTVDEWIRQCRNTLTAHDEALTAQQK